MKKENCTKGPVRVGSGSSIRSSIRAGERGGPDSFELARVMSKRIVNNRFQAIPKEEREAGAELIAEAFNVLHETGMTPRELVDGLRSLSAMLSTINAHGIIPGATREQTERGIRTLLSKYQPTIPQQQ